MNKVLIALDYDPTAQKVAETGFSFAKSMGAEVILLHVIADAPYYSEIQFSQAAGFFGYNSNESSHLFDDGPKNAMQKFLDKSKKHLGDENIKTLVEEGDFAETILKTAKDLHADVIVMGSHSRKWMENILMGSVAKEVLQNSSIPLFIIPTKQKK